MIKLNPDEELKLIAVLPDLHNKIHSNLRNIFSAESTLLADIRDYFHFQVVNCQTKEEARQLIKTYEEYIVYLSNENLSELYQGYFFALVNVLTIKFQITTFPNEKISYQAFEDSFIYSIKVLGIKKTNPSPSFYAK